MKTSTEQEEEAEDDDISVRNPTWEEINLKRMNLKMVKMLKAFLSGRKIGKWSSVQAILILIFMNIHELVFYSRGSLFSSLFLFASPILLDFSVIT